MLEDSIDVSLEFTSKIQKVQILTVKKLEIYFQEEKSLRGSLFLTMSRFSESADYKSVLQRLKNEFETKWRANQPSSNEKSSDYEHVCVLGSGAYGIVVSKLNFRRETKTAVAISPESFRPFLEVGQA